MFKIYNSRAITRQERFHNAIIFGVGATILITLAYGFLSYYMTMEISIVYLAAGYGIGTVIRKYGRGVQIQFSILAACLAVFCFVVGDLISIFGWNTFTHPELWGIGFQFVFTRLLSMNINSLLALLFRAGGVYLAYTTSRLV